MLQHQEQEQLEQFEAIYQNEMEIKSRNTIDMNMYFSYQAFIDKLSKIKQRQELGLVQLQEQEERAKQNYLEKQKQRKIIESLLKKHQYERMVKAAKAEQKLTDDIVSSKMARRLMENNDR